MSRVFRREGGKNYYGEWIDRTTGEPVRRSLKTTKKGEAERILFDLEVASANQAKKEEERTETLGESIARFIESVRDIAPATRKFYIGKGRWLNELMGDIQIGKLTRSDIEDYISQRLEDVRPTTVKKELTTLSRVLGYAIDRDAWDGDRKRIIPRLKDDYAPKDRWLTRTEYAAVLGALPVDKQFWLVVGIHTGARLSEMHGLKWTDVDFDANVIKIRGTKTVGSRRAVPITSELRRWLEAKTHREGFLLDEWTNYRRGLRLACERVGVESISANDLRRTFASWLLQAEVPTFTVAKLLGHNSTKMVERIYGQLGLGTFKAAMAAFPDSQKNGRILDVCPISALLITDTYETQETQETLIPKRLDLVKT